MSMLQDRPQLDRALDLAGIPPEGRTVQFSLAPPDLRDGTPPAPRAATKASARAPVAPAKAPAKALGKVLGKVLGKAPAKAGKPPPINARASPPAPPGCAPASTSPPEQGATMTITSTTTAPAAATNSGTGTSDPLSSITNNFNNFLQLLMTQLQNQDPTSPMDTTSSPASSSSSPASSSRSTPTPASPS